MTSLELGNAVSNDFRNGVCSCKVFGSVAVFLYPDETITSEGNPAYRFVVCEKFPNGAKKFYECYWLYKKSYRSRSGKSRVGRIYRVGSELDAISYYYSSKQDSDGCRYARLCDSLRSAVYVLRHPTTAKPFEFKYNK